MVVWGVAPHRLCDCRATLDRREQQAAALGGHVARCENDACGHTVIAFNSCRDRHCPRCQGAASRKWLEAREADLLPASYFHVVYTLPAELRDVAYQNKAVIYGLLMKASAETTLQIAAERKHLGARIADHPMQRLDDLLPWKWKAAREAAPAIKAAT